MSQTVAQMLTRAIAMLRAAGVADPPRDARRLAADAMGIEPARLGLHMNDMWPAEATARWQAHLAARSARQPVAQIVGWRDFYGRRFVVTPDVLDPRPETETLIEAALQRPARRVLDIGTGSGCILLTLLAEWPDARGVGTDLSRAALSVAGDNAARLGVAARAGLVACDWATGLHDSFDLVVSNPPYIPLLDMADLAPEVRRWEPAMALSPGPDGLEAYRAIIPQALRRLSPGGRLLLETGAGQGSAVMGLCVAHGFEKVEVLPDLDGRSRVVRAIRAGSP